MSAKKIRHQPKQGDVRFAWHGFALVLIWALIFLPGLGGPEYKGEEPRRVQPAIAMLDTGEWIVPHIGGKPYYNKPPLINWLVAGAFSIAGERTEAAARAVSVVATLVLALVIYAVGCGWMGPPGAFIAAVAAITHVSMLDKGRLIEIEPLYMALFGVALALWIAQWAKGEQAHPAVQWPGSFFFLGLGILAKGPLHLVFFYGTVIAILWRGRALRGLWSLWHAAGLVVMIGVTAAWMIPFFAKTSGDKALGTWQGQMSSRIAGEQDRLVSWEWLLNLPKGLSNFLPWTLLLLVLVWLFFRRPEKTSSEGDARIRAISSGLLLALALFSIGLAAIPGILPRYTMPMLTVAAIWMGLQSGLLGHRALGVWRGTVLALAGLAGLAAGVGIAFAPEWIGKVYCGVGVIIGGGVIWLLIRPREAQVLALGTGLVCGIAMLCYAGVAIPRMVVRDDVRPVGELINQRAGSEALRYAVSPGSRPFLAYVAPGLKYAESLKQVPAEGNYVIIRESDWKKEEPTEGWFVDLEFRDRGKERFVLLKRLADQNE